MSLPHLARSDAMNATVSTAFVPTVSAASPDKYLSAIRETAQRILYAVIKRPIATSLLPLGQAEIWSCSLAAVTNALCGGK